MKAVPTKEYLVRDHERAAIHVFFSDGAYNTVPESKIFEYGERVIDHQDSQRSDK